MPFRARAKTCRRGAPDVALSYHISDTELWKGIRDFSGDIGKHYDWRLRVCWLALGFKALPSRASE